MRSRIVALLQDAPDVEVIGGAASGADAVETILQLKPDLMMMDLRMPPRSIPSASYCSAVELDGEAATAKILAGIRSVARGEVALVASGNNNPSTARVLFLSEATVRTRCPSTMPRISNSITTRAPP